jgi:hypothetical protein
MLIHQSLGLVKHAQSMVDSSVIVGEVLDQGTHKLGAKVPHGSSVAPEPRAEWRCVSLDAGTGRLS